MATVHTPPIDLYAESTEGPTEEREKLAERASQEWRRPSSNGERDQPAIDAGQGRLDQVLGW